MAEDRKKPISGATFTIHNRSDDSLVKTLTEADLTYSTSNLSPGEYYIKVVKSGYGTIIKNFDAIQGETESPIIFDLVMFPGVSNVPVTLKDKDDAYITDAIVKIDNILGVYDGTGNKYDVADVPVSTTSIKRTLEITHATSTYQSISKQVSIQSGITFPDEILYPVIDIYIKIYGIKEDTSQVDLTTRSNCIIYNPTSDNTNLDSTTRISKTGGYAKMASKNDGEYKIIVPSFSTVIDGINYTVPKIEEAIYVDYVSSTSGDVFVNLNANLQK